MKKYLVMIMTICLAFSCSSVDNAKSSTDTVVTKSTTEKNEQEFVSLIMRQFELIEDEATNDFNLSMMYGLNAMAENGDIKNQDEYLEKVRNLNTRLEAKFNEKKSKLNLKEARNIVFDWFEAKGK